MSNFKIAGILLRLIALAFFGVGLLLVFFMIAFAIFIFGVPASPSWEISATITVFFVICSNWIFGVAKAVEDGQKQGISVGYAIAFVALIGFPIGTILGIATLYFLDRGRNLTA